MSDREKQLSVQVGGVSWLDTVVSSKDDLVSQLELLIQSLNDGELDEDMPKVWEGE